MGTQVEESHNSVGMHVTWPRHATLTSLLLGWWARLELQHVDTFLVAWEPAWQWQEEPLEQLSLPASLALLCTETGTALEGTALWKANWDLEVWKMLFPPLWTNPNRSPCIMQCCLKNTADAAGGTCHLWKQTLKPVPCWLSQGCGGHCTHGHRDGHTDSSPAGRAGGTQLQQEQPRAHRHSPVGPPRAQPGTHAASRESKMTWNTNGFVPFQTKLLFWYYKPFFFIHKSRLWYKH